MLKIYRAFAENGKIKLQDHIDFKNGCFDTGINGFGMIKLRNNNCDKVNYELQKLQEYKSYLQNLYCKNGYVRNFEIVNPCTHQMIAEKCNNISKTFEEYEKNGLNEEGVLLFTDLVRISYISKSSVQKLFGRYPEKGLYLVMPNASFSLMLGAVSEEIKENYQLLQGISVGKKLILQKVNR